MKKNIKIVSLFSVLFIGAVVMSGIGTAAHAQYATTSMQITPSTVPDGVMGAPYSETLTVVTSSASATAATGAFSWSLSGSLPSGLSLDTTAAGPMTTISGTPDTEGQYTFTVQVTNEAAAATQTFTMNIAPSAMATMAATTTIVTPTATVSATSAELESELSALTAQLTQLEAMTGMGAPTAAPAPSAPVDCGTATFCRDLTIGDTGNDVLALQQFLNTNGSPVASSGPGSSGNETQYFGTLTQTALASWQSTNNISPAQGYFGPVTRAAVEAVLSGSSSPSSSTQ